MTLNIDTRIFNFNGKDMRLGKKYIRYVWFYRDNIRVSDNISLLIIPCENEFLRDCCVGIKYKALKNEFANKGENGLIKLEMNFQDDNLLSDELKNNKVARFKLGNFHIFRTKILVSSNFLRNTIESKTFKYQKKILPYAFYEADELLCDGKNAKINVSYGDNENEFVALRKGAFLNGLNRNKSFVLYYDDYGYGQIYKAVQDDLILFEHGTSYK